MNFFINTAFTKITLNMGRKFYFFNLFYIGTGFPGGSDSKQSAYNVRDLGLNPGLRRSPGEGNGYPSSILAWRIPWTEKPDGL